MRLLAIGTLALASLALAACGSGGPVAAPVPATPSSQAPTVAVASDQATGLVTPWGLARLADGTALVSERDTGRIVRVSVDGAVTEFTRLTETAASGEGGLMGLAIDPTDTWLYAYVTTASDNRVVRVPLDNPSAPREPVLSGIPKAETHNGGRLTFGPDGMLYVATGDIREDALAQDPTSLAGKILRIDPEGAVPEDNPFPGSPVWSLGHRNVQGLAFDSEGRLWATEFGEKDADELNLIRAGGNYGWPIVEGTAPSEGVDLPDGYVDPQAQWSPTSLASPSGLAIVDDIAYVASLRGEVLWQVPLVGDRAAEPVALDLGDLGRLRTIEAMSDGTLWLMTSNTDGRGEPRPEDDRIVVLRLGA